MTAVGDTSEILHVFPTFARGGRESRTVQILAAMTDRRHELVSLDGRTDALEGHSLPHVQVTPFRERSQGTNALVRHIRAVKPRLVLTYNWGAIEAVAAALVARVPAVIHVEDGFGNDERLTLKARRVWARRLLLNRIRTTIVPSHALLRICLERFKLRPTRVSYIPNGVDTHRFSPSPDVRSQIRAQLGIAQQAVVFGMVGRLSPEKNVSLALECFAQVALPDVRFLLVGDGECRRALEAEVRSRGLEGRIFFAGSTSAPERFYRAMDVFVMSSLTEQMPLALLEAMACELPCVCTDVGDTVRMLAAPNRRLVIPGDERARFADALRELATNAPLRSALGVANRAAVEACYSQRRMIEQHVGLYQECLGR